MSRIIMPRLTGVFAQVETWRLVARSPWRRMTGARLDIKPATLVHVQARLVLIVSGSLPMRAFRSCWRKKFARRSAPAHPSRRNGRFIIAVISEAILFAQAAVFLTEKARKNRTTLLFCSPSPRSHNPPY
jgi:hypothetical protein